MMKTRISYVLAMMAVAGLVGGCSGIETKRKVKYENVQTLPPLEVPPDLAQMPSQGRNPIDPAPGGSTTYSEYSSAQQTVAQRLNQPGGVVLPDFPDVQVRRAGQERWLVIKAAPEAVWPKVRAFILQTGLLIDQEDAAAGILRTAWADNRAKVGSTEQGLFSSWFGSLYSTGERDMYRIRLERGVAPDTTEVYIAHYGMEEVIASNDPVGAVQTRWQRRPADPTLEAEMLALLMVDFGVSLEDARKKVGSVKAPEGASMTETSSGAPVLQLNDNLERSWHRVAVSLDRVGYMVEKTDRTDGVLYVRHQDVYEEPKTGFLSGLFGGDEKAEKKPQYRVVLNETDARTTVQVMDDQGAPAGDRTGKKILASLYEQLK